MVMRNDRTRTTIGVGKKETSQIHKVEECSWNVQVLDLVRARKGESSVMTNAISLQDYDSLDTINDFVSSDLEIITVETIGTNNIRRLCIGVMRKETDDLTKNASFVCL